MKGLEGLPNRTPIPTIVRPNYRGLMAERVTKYLLVHLLNRRWFALNQGYEPFEIAAGD
jgi:hypothetical protein